MIATLPEPASTSAPTVTASALLSVIVPLPVLVVPAMLSVPLVLVMAILPAPVAVAVKLAPFASVMNTPPEPADAVMVSAFVRMGVPDEPIALVPVVLVLSATVPPTPLFSVPDAWVIEPPALLLPPAVVTAIVPPAPVVMSRSAAPPVPLAALFTLIATAPAPVLPVVIVPPAFCVNPAASAPAVFALIAIAPPVAPPSAALSVTASPLFSVIVPVPVFVAPAMFSVPLVLISAMLPAPVAVAVKLAPSDSVTLILPLVVFVAATVAAVVNTAVAAPGAPEPIPFAAVRDTTLPERMLGALLVIAPPTADTVTFPDVVTLWPSATLPGSPPVAVVPLLTSLIAPLPDVMGALIARLPRPARRLVPPDPASAPPPASVSVPSVWLAIIVIRPARLVPTAALTVMVRPACMVRFAFGVNVKLTGSVTVMSFCA